MRNICLLQSRWAPPRIWERIGWAGGGKLKKESVRQREGSGEQHLGVSGRTRPAATSSPSSARSPPPAATALDTQALPRLVSPHRRCSGAGERKRGCGNLESVEPKQITSKRLI